MLVRSCTVNLLNKWNSINTSQEKERDTSSQAVNQHVSPILYTGLGPIEFAGTSGSGFDGHRVADPRLEGSLNAKHNEEKKDTCWIRRPNLGWSQRRRFIGG